MGKKPTRTRLGPQPLRLLQSCGATDRLQLNFRCGRRLADVAAFVPKRQCKAGHSAIPAMTLFIAWRKPRNHPSAPTPSCLRAWWCSGPACQSPRRSPESSRGACQTPVAPCAEPRLTSYWPPLEWSGRGEGEGRCYVVSDIACSLHVT